MIGANTITVQLAVSGTSLVSVSTSALCAEQISNRANIVCFMLGTDTLVANIFAQSVSQIRAQCVRIARQLAAQGQQLDRVSASILVTLNGSDIDIFSGEKVSTAARRWEALKDRFVGKFVPALVTVFFASLWMAGTPALKSAEIGLVAAVVGALLDALVAALSAGNWKWKESK
jgi:hypothetical protein